MLYRIQFKKYNISRDSDQIARYMMLRHKQEVPNPNRLKTLSKAISRYQRDGINSMNYQLVDRKMLPLFTWFLVKFQNVPKDKKHRVHRD